MESNTLLLEYIATTITCRIDLMTTSGDVLTGLYRLWYPGSDCRDTQTNQYQDIKIYNR
jgi:hypothetical protein